MADELNTTPDAVAPVEKSFTQMSAKEMADLIRKEGDNYITQITEGGIDPSDFVDSENYTNERLMNLYFSYEYFSETRHGQDSGLSPIQEKVEYLDLYAMIHSRIEQDAGMNLFGVEYLIKL
jgi:hypothetical protein